MFVFWFSCFLPHSLNKTGSPRDSVVRIHLPIQKTWIQSLGREDPLKKEMAVHSSNLAWEIHGQRSLMGYSTRGHKRVRHDLVTEQHT